MTRLNRVLICIVIGLILLLPRYSAALLVNGDFNAGLSGWGVNGNVIEEEGAAVFRTGGIYGEYDTSLYTTFVVSGDSLSFRYYFDVSGIDGILSPDFPSFPFDSFQVSIDDGDNGYIVESLPWSPAGIFAPFMIDISDFRPGTLVTLSFDLIDQDDGFTSIAAIDDAVDPIAGVPEPRTLVLLGTGLIGLYLAGRFKRQIICRLLVMIVFSAIVHGPGIAHSELIEENIDDTTRIDFTSPLFNTRTNTLSLNMTVTNIGDNAILTPLKVIITGISTPDVTVANPDGFTPEGLPYYDLTVKIPDHELSPGEASQAVKILFYNPKRIKFRWDQDVMALVDVYTDEGLVLENICLVSGEFPPVCEYDPYDIEIRNPEFDRLFGRWLPEMYRYEQVRVYAYDYEELPVSVAINGEDAVYNEEGFYYYRDIVLHEGQNLISAEVINQSGMNISRVVTLNIDTIPPNIGIIQPAPGSVVTSPELVLEGTVDDPAVTGVSLIHNYFNSSNIPVQDGMFQTNVSLQPGHNNITIEASDFPGNSVATNIDIVYAYTRTSQVTGRIFHSSLGIPLAGAVVTMLPGDGEPVQVVSDKDGRFSAEDINSGDVVILVEKAGYETKNISICALGGDNIPVQDITLQPLSLSGTLTLTGQIKDTAEQPVEGVTVSVKGSPLSTVSDSNGIYLISAIPRSSFEANASLSGYLDSDIHVNAGAFGEETSVLVYNFILRNVSYSIGISYPSDGAGIEGGSTVVTGFAGEGDMDAGVRVNGVLANVHNGYFTANGVPLSNGMNTIKAEMINEKGTLASDSIEIFRMPAVEDEFAIHAQEAGTVPIKLKVTIEEPWDVSFRDFDLVISGPSAAQVLADDRLHYTVLISEPGVYLFTFSGTDLNGNRHSRGFSFTGMTRDDAEGILRTIWGEFRGQITSGNSDAALSKIIPQTRSGYREQFLMAGPSLPDFFSDIGDIQLVELSDNMAKARLNHGGLTHYIWFSRDIYGLWKVYKF